MSWADRIGRRLKLRDVHVLVAVAETGSMGRAAERLGVSQPVVSKTIADLEYTLGVRLLDRRRDGIEVTPYGQALLKRGLAAFDELRHGIKEIEFLSDPTAGEVRLAATAPHLAGLVPDAIKRLRRQHPRLSFHVTEAITGPALFDSLRQRTVDFVIGRVSHRRLDKDLSSEILFEEQACIVAGVRNSWAKRRKIELADLINEPWVLPPPDTAPGRLIVDEFHACGLNIPDTAVFSICIPLTSSLVATGDFLAGFPQSTLRFNGRELPFKILPVQLLATRSPVALVTLKNRTLSPAALLTIAGIREIAKPSAKPE